jgi:hypothetical protein
MILNKIRNSLFLLFLLSIIPSSFAFAPFSGKDDLFTNPTRLALKERTMHGHKPLNSYSEARKMVMNKVYLSKGQNGYYVHDVYCGQDILLPNQNTMPSSNVINIEHTWPQSRFNQSANSSIQKTDLHHLYPTNSQANSIRGHEIFVEVNSNEPIFDGCPNSFNGPGKNSGVVGFEPPDEQKGNVARALFYFSIRYEIEISQTEEAVLRKWNVLDPVNAVDKKRNDMIETIQGNRNPFVDDSRLVDTIDNF